MLKCTYNNNMYVKSSDNMQSLKRLTNVVVSMKRKKNNKVCARMREIKYLQLD